MQELCTDIVAAASDALARDRDASVPGVLGLLGLLRTSLLCDDRDLAELRFGPRGDAAALYPARRQSTTAFLRLFRAAALGRDGEAILWSFLANVPAERHFVRLGDGSVSVFFKTDVPSRALGTLCEPLGLRSLASSATRLSETVGSEPCGVAVEVGDSHPRLRLYWHPRSWSADMSSLGRLAVSELRLHRSCRVELTRAWSSATPEPARVVINLGATRDEPPSLKLELPRVPLLRARFLARADSDALGRALAFTRSASFSYVGLRWSAARDREATFYVDAGPYLASRRGGA